MNRKLPIGKMMDQIKVPRYHMNDLILPVSIPQISDARINVQTFNPPPKPLLPGMLPTEKYMYHIKVPENEEKPDEEIHYHHKRNLNLILPGTFDKKLNNIVQEAFDEAFKKHIGNHPEDNISSRQFNVNILESDGERKMKDEMVHQKIKNVVSRIAVLNQKYAGFQNEVQSKVASLDDKIRRVSKINLNYIVD